MKRPAIRRRKTLYGIIALALAFALAGCKPTSGVTETSSPEATAAPTASSAALSPTLSPSPIPMEEPEPVLPKKGSGDGSTFEVICPIPDEPVFPVWSYRTVKSEFELNILASRIWADEAYKLAATKDHSNVIENATTESGIITIVHDALLKISMSYQNNVTKPAEGDFSLDDAWLRGEDFLVKFLGDMDYYSNRIGPFNNVSVPAHILNWMRKLNGYRVTGELLTTEISNVDGEVTAFYGDWHTLEPDKINPPVKPITFEQALYALEYYRSCALSDEPDSYRDSKLTMYNIFEENDRVESVEIVYTDAFHKETAIFAPAWVFQVHGGSSMFPSDILVDMETGELYVEGYSRWPSPYPARGSTPSGAKIFEQWDAYIAEIESLSTIEFAQKDGYTYIFRIPDYSQDFTSADEMMREGASIWRRNDVTGEEILLDDRAAFSMSNLYWDTRNSFFAALVDDRIIFRGYDGDLDYKTGGRFVSIALDGSDRRSLRTSANVALHICADGDRVYYVGAGRGDPFQSPLNYLNSDLSKDRGLFYSPKTPFAVVDGIAYAIDNSTNITYDRHNVYRRSGDEWEVYKVMPYEIDEVVFIMEEKAWRFYHDGGDFEMFRP